MPGDQEVYRQLGELMAEVRAIRADGARHDRTTEAMRKEIGHLQVQIGGLKAEGRTAVWITRAFTAAVGALAGALAGHIPVPPGAN